MGIPSAYSYYSDSAGGAAYGAYGAASAGIVIAPDQNIVITFSEAVDPLTVTNVGNGTGSFEVRNNTSASWVAGVLSTSDNVQWTFNPDVDFTDGDSVTVHLTSAIETAVGADPYDGPFEIEYTVVEFTFTPADISPDAWYDFSDATTLFTDAGVTPVASDGDLIYQANDKSGNNRHQTQTTAANRPLYKTAIQNGLSVARFDGINDYLENVGFNISQPFTAYLVFKIAETGVAVVFSSISGDANLFYGNQPDEMRLDANLVEVIDGSRDTAFNIYKTVSDGSSSSIVKNNVTTATGTIGAAPITGLRLMANGGPGNWAQGDLCEVVFKAGTVSGADDSNMWTYLNNEWGIY